MRKSLTIILVIVLLILSSCSNRDDDIVDEDYHRGSEGLRLEFMRNAPPDRVYSGNELDIIVEVRNMGAYPTTDSFDGIMALYGFDEKAFSGERWDGSPFLSPNLQGRSQFSPMGGREAKRYHIDKVYTLFDQEFYEPTIIAAACYKYKTEADAQICVDPDPYSMFERDKVCTLPQAGRTYSLGTQGAPVAVSSIKEEVSSDSIHFSIYIDNVGKGSVVDERAINDCPPIDLDYSERDRLMVTAKLPWDAAPVCQPRGDYTDPVYLDESGNGFIFCTFRKPAQKEAFETTLHIELDYRYFDWVDKRIRIINLDR